MTKFFCHTKFAEQSEVSQSPCHTERSEVSINSKCALNSVDFFAVACALQPVGSLCANAVRTKRINLSNIRQIYAILTTKPYLVGLDIFEKDKNDNHTAI